MSPDRNSSELFALPGRDSYFEDLRTDGSASSTRLLLSGWWREYARYADLDFLTKARNDDFLSRFWEMYLAKALLEQGISLVEREQRQASRAGNPGPDIRTSDSPPIWIEAIAPTPGEGPDRVPARELGRVREVPDSEAKLRLLSSIRAKARDRLRYVADGLVGARDPYVIAINTAKIPRVPDLEPPRIVRSVLGLGMPTVTLDLETRRVVGLGMSEQAHVTKQSGADVSARVLVDPEEGDDEPSGYEGVSAVLACEITPYNCEPPFFDSDKYLLGDGFCLVHSRLAANPLPRGTIALGAEYWVNDDCELERVDWYQKGKRLPRRP